MYILRRLRQKARIRFLSNFFLTGNRVLFPVIAFIIMMMLKEISLQGQDVHFSQFFSVPMYINPACTGMSGEDMRIAVNYRNQWAKIGAPYETYGASLDRKLTVANHLLGIGGVIIHDRSSLFSLSSNDFMLSLSYSKIINNQQITVGLQPTFVTKSFDQNGLYFGSQFDEISEIYNTSLPSLESTLNGRLSYFDLNIGIFWRTMIRNLMPSAGISASHINMPVERFSTSSSGTRLPVKLSFTSDIIIQVNSKVNLTPLLLYSFTPGANELILGSCGDYSIGNFNIPVKKLYAVSLIRINPVKNADAVILGGGIKFLKINIGVTYDFNISPLNAVTNLNGAFEVSLVYTGSKRSQENPNQHCFIMN